jgi:hypothetical protein
MVRWILSAGTQRTDWVRGPFNFPMIASNCCWIGLDNSMATNDRIASIAQAPGGWKEKDKKNEPIPIG